jgi:transposase-like protein
LERDGHVRTKVVPNVAADTLVPTVKDHVAMGSAVYTDEHSGYLPLQRRITAMDPEALKVDEERLGEPMYEHEAVNHTAEEYVRGNVHVNGMENFWSLLKRTIRGTYVSVEPFHLFRYLDEQAYRFNQRKDSNGGRFMRAVRAIVGKRLTYKHLIGMDGVPAPVVSPT